MSDELPGPHHCIGTARAVTEIVFRSLRAQCTAGGGTLSLEEIDSFYSRIIDSFSSGFDLFELRHRRCMDASLSSAAMPFARGKILSTFLRACGEKSAQATFSVQVERMGVEWIDLLFGGLARYVREHVHADYENSFNHCLCSHCRNQEGTYPHHRRTVKADGRRKRATELRHHCVRGAGRTRVESQRMSATRSMNLSRSKRASKDRMYARSTRMRRFAS